MDIVAAFSNPEAASQYADGPPRFVPGLADLHRMATLLLSERTPRDARVLVLGAGGGLELRAFAEARPHWTFDGVDPALEMLQQAERTLGSMASRATLHHGYIDDAPLGPFDAAACLLTLHFLGYAERVRTAREIRRRMSPGAPLVVAHSSFPQRDEERGAWLSRYAEFAIASGTDPEKANKARSMVAAHLEVMTPEQDEEILREAGFSNVSLFYAALTWRGWVANA
ncbi:methyltransferase [Hyphomicrobium methylovorum]|uniref:class I SAM-dependent methyltransferase n=1 Tax=Hyphomicrobium methylovorum TaxID=84 RepID=UPI0015E6D29C|nr:class I SAM-dependent methyltransferase [Hyphomicrobium methylovorum]MBA2126059.1 methyltransferase [Hyphomicrobium methylovorum]